MAFNKPFIVGSYINDEVRGKHFWEAIEEANLRFMLASLRGETFRLDGTGQSKISSKKWKNANLCSERRFIMNIYYLLIGIGFLLVSIAHFLSIRKGRGIYFWDKYSIYKSTKRNFKVLILIEFLTGSVLIFLAII